MSETSWSGALAPRKKGELLELAAELGIRQDQSITKNELVDLLKTFIDIHETTLIEDPKYKGLYGRKVRRTSAVPVATDESDESTAAIIVPVVPPATTATRRRAAKPFPRPASPVGSVNGSGVAPSQALASPALTPETPSRIALPVSPTRSILKGIKEISELVRPEVDVVVANVARSKDQFGAETEKALAATKRFLSNSPNIASISVLWEIALLLYAFIPWQTTSVSFVPPTTENPLQIPIPYPPSAVFLSGDLYYVLLKWAFPTLFIPQLIGALISFTDRTDIDPVSSGIVRLACVCSTSWGVSEDILSAKTRIISAATALAFAVAESIVDRKDRAEVQQQLIALD